MSALIDMNNCFTWTEFYMEFANCLLEYQEDRLKLIEIVIEAFEDTNLKFPFMDNKIIVEDICPFTVMGSFNKGLTDANRKLIAESIGNRIGVTSPVPDDFVGIPILNNMSSWFFWGRDHRGDNDIPNLWNLFKYAIDYAESQCETAKQEFCTFYNKALNQNGVKWNITMALYWIRPYTYLNLDTTNREYLLKENSPYNKDVSSISKLKSVPSAEEYLLINDKIKSIIESADSLHKNLPEISRGAWLASQDDKPSSNDKISDAAFLRWFSPIIEALKKLEGSATPDQVREQIIIDEKLSDNEVSEVRGKTNVNKFKNDVAFARNYLVYAGYLDNSQRGIWQLTPKGWDNSIDKKTASDIFRKYSKKFLSKNVSDEQRKTKYWIYSAGNNSNEWDAFYNDGIMAISWEKVGDLSNYNSKSELNKEMKKFYGEEYSHKNSTLALWQFVADIEPGDIVYVKKGRDKVIGRGIVESDYIFNEAEEQYPHIRKVKWTHKGDWPHPGQAVVKTLTDLTSYTEYVEKLKSLFIDENMDVENIEDEYEKEYPIYTQENFLDDVFMSSSRYENLVSILMNKKNVILQGAPGVGKTFSAKRIAYSIMGKEDTSRVMLVQFHQNYSYENFVMGYQPDKEGFKLVEGPFYQFCKTALDDDENNYFFIIDEINRGNMSKIFGELLMLIENDKRGKEIRLMYSNELFSVPSNVYVIGMMNTADRSLAMIDYALRRRFSFFNFEPAFTSRGFKDLLLKANNEKLNKLVDIIIELNKDITKDDSLGNGFQIGHSYFCSAQDSDDSWLMNVIEYEIIPLLNEYWFDEPSKIENWTSRLRGVIND